MPPTMPKTPGLMLGRHLGRRPPTEEQRKKALPLRPFLKLAVRPVPAASDYSGKAPKALASMMDNDREGCCVATTIMKHGALHAGSRPGGTEYVATDAETSKLYHQIGGPGDNGLVIIEALDFVRDKGFKVGNVAHSIEGYASIGPTDLPTMTAACHWFGGVHAGVALPRDWYTNADDSDVWDMTDSPIVGGHSIPFTAFDAERFKLATWARQPHITRRAIESGRYVDEAYAVLGRDWYNAEGLDTNAVNVTALRDAMEAMKRGGTPDIPDDPNPPTPPTPPAPWSWQWEHTWNVFFGDLTAMAGLRWTTTQLRKLTLDWSAMVSAVVNLVGAVWRKDWTAAINAALQIIALLGVTMTPENVERLKSYAARGGFADVRIPDAMIQPESGHKLVDSGAA